MPATAADAQVILQLYDLRREAEMRKARSWWFGTFWPTSADEAIAILQASGTQENNWLRQVVGYWEIAAALVLHGAVSEDLFLETSFSGEMFFLFAKMQPFLKETREKMQAPRMLGNIEKVATGSERAREVLKQFEQRVANRRKAMAAAQGR
jgi:hypothetical protein